MGAWGLGLDVVRRPTVVAVPARDEAERIIGCLEALTTQRDLGGAPIAPGVIKVLVLANNCRDATADVARRAGADVEVLEVDLPLSRANAGVARRAAMDAAAERLPPGPGLICTTDADSRPRPDWVARLWKAMDEGAEAVAGAVEFDPLETTGLDFSDARRREGLYSALQAEIIARVDPEAHNPWPNHIWAWGANLAVTASAYRRVGGLPAQPLAEDRAFVEQLRRHDVPVRHCLDARVWTSARRIGRAEGGLASLVDAHIGGDETPCDAALEPARDALRRATWRRRLRRAYQDREPAEALAARFGINADVLALALCEDAFGSAWSLLERRCPRLAPRRLKPSELPAEIRRAERLLARISPDGRVDRAGRAHAASAGLWSAPASP